MNTIEGLATCKAETLKLSPGAVNASEQGYKLQHTSGSQCKT